MLFTRRHALVTTAAAILPFGGPARAQAATFTYRGFSVDATAAHDLPNFTAIANSLKHQIDIAADCGTAATVLTFFRSQPIAVKPGQADGGGHFSTNSPGVSVDAAVTAPEKP